MRFALPTAICMLASAAPALASPVRYELDTSDELIADGWMHDTDRGSTTFIGGVMVTDAPGFDEWMIASGGDSKWWRAVDAKKGWWVEWSARIERLTSEPCYDAGPGVWIHDGTKLVKVTMRNDSAGFSYPFQQRVTVDTSNFHTYRVQDLGDGVVELLIDGAVAIHTTMAGGGAGSEVLNFGDLGGCNGGSRVSWDYFEYDTAAPGTEALDPDHDGIPNAEDNCFELENLDQEDGDRDRRGDLCDTCPIDLYDDSDSDGLCDSEDPCPGDPANLDDDHNGICDILETQNPNGLPVGIDPVSDQEPDQGCACADAASSGSRSILETILETALVALTLAGVRPRKR